MTEPAKHGLGGMTKSAGQEICKSDGSTQQGTGQEESEDKGKGSTLGHPQGEQTLYILLKHVIFAEHLQWDCGDPYN